MNWSKFNLLLNSMNAKKEEAGLDVTNFACNMCVRCIDRSVMYGARRFQMLPTNIGNNNVSATMNKL
jgi:hypothetical protein